MCELGLAVTFTDQLRSDETIEAMMPTTPRTFRTAATNGMLVMTLPRILMPWTSSVLTANPIAALRIGTLVGLMAFTILSARVLSVLPTKVDSAPQGSAADRTANRRTPEPPVAATPVPVDRAARDHCWAASETKSRSVMVGYKTSCGRLRSWPVSNAFDSFAP